VLTLIVILLAVILLVLLGVAVVGVALKLLWWALIGLVIGALARLVLPGMQPIGWLGTVLAGIGGALLGGIVADAFDVGGIVELLLAIAVAAALIAAFAGSTRESYGEHRTGRRAASIKRSSFSTRTWGLLLRSWRGRLG
jgi:uncharacterized membrane protein YeaQ/YmgE (transglycosylase-associated protein family)